MNLWMDEFSEFEQRRAPGKKNTKKWCKGKVGREHTPELVLRVWYGFTCREITRYFRNDRKPPQTFWQCLHHTVCSTCGKVLDFWPPKDCPDRPGATEGKFFGSTEPSGH